MNKKIICFLMTIILMCCAAAGAAEYKFTYKKGKIDVNQNEIKTGADSVFAISYGAAAEVRCGPDSRLEINSITKTGESVFTLQQGSCFVRIIDDTSGAGITLNTPFVVLKSTGGAFYADCVERSASVYGGSASIEFNKRIARLTAGRTFYGGKITENKPAGADSWKEWNFMRDKTDIYMKLGTDIKMEEVIKKILADALTKGYAAGKIYFTEIAEPQDTAAFINIKKGQVEFTASGKVSSEISGIMGIIDVKKGAMDDGYGNSPREAPVNMPFIYEIAAAIQKAVEQAEAGFMKNGRKTIIEAEGLSEADCRVIEKAVQAMPGFINSTRKMYHNTKAVFEVLQAGTGYDLAEVLTEKFKKTNISIWKYSKNIVKLRVVKVKG